MPAIDDHGVFLVDDNSRNVTATDVTVGADTATEAMLSFGARGVLVGHTEGPPTNPETESIGRYFDAEAEAVRTTPSSTSTRRP